MIALEISLEFFVCFCFSFEKLHHHGQCTRTHNLNMETVSTRHVERLLNIYEHIGRFSKLDAHNLPQLFAVADTTNILHLLLMAGYEYNHNAQYLLYNEHKKGNMRLLIQLLKSHCPEKLAQ